MSANNSAAVAEVYHRLKKGFNQFSRMMNVHLDDALLQEMGVDPLLINLEEETERGGPYFLPLSQEHINTWIERREFCIEYDDEMDSPITSFSDGDFVHLAFRSQLLYNNNGDVSSWAAYQSSHWRPR